jgi:hypothetical protein
VCCDALRCLCDRAHWVAQCAGWSQHSGCRTQTNQPYPLPWAPHHLGYWPIADLPYTKQENMPLEETAWDLLIIAAIAQRQGGDLTWLTPYWSVLQTWYEFLITLLPFPGTQLSTDDFDGVLYNATNLAVKGVAAIAAYGYIYEGYTGDAAGAAAIYATAARYSSVMVQYAWHSNGTDSHFMIGYAGSQGDGGDPSSWPMLYNALWLRLLGFDALLPNQAALLAQQAAWYQANVMEEYGLPLNSRKTYTKDDWCARALWVLHLSCVLRAAQLVSFAVRLIGVARARQDDVPRCDILRQRQPAAALAILQHALLGIVRVGE